MNVWEQTGQRPRELDNLAELPTSCYECWSWFLNLNESRTSNGFGFNPISYSDIDAFFRLRKIIPEQWEVDLIKRLDRETLGIYAEKAKMDAKK
jgi:hypothetical protein